MTGLAIGVVSVAVLATAGALDSAGGAATIASPTPPPPQVVRGDALGGCCSGRGGIHGIVGDRIQCRDASYSLDCSLGPSGIIHHHPDPTDAAAAAGTQASAASWAARCSAVTARRAQPAWRADADNEGAQAIKPPLGRALNAPLKAGATTAPARRRLR